jgi:hypothetical protein
MVRDVDIQTNGTIFYNSVQLLSYADDIDIIARLYKTLIRPALTYTLETWILSTSDVKALAILERKVLMSIYDQSKITMNGEFGTNMNCMLCMKAWIL